MSRQLTGEELEAQAQRFLNGLSGHLVSLAGTAVPLDSQGRDAGKETFFSFSGFVISFMGHWLYITAGHVLEGLDGQIRHGQIRLVHCHFLDAFGQGLESVTGAPFDLPGAKKVYLDNDQNAFDVAVLAISPMYKKLMEKHSVKPFVMDGWDQPLGVNLTDFAILGLPDEKMERTRRVSVTGATVIGGVRVVAMFADLSDAKPSIPPATGYHWLALKLRDQANIKSIEGMSGGPVIGFHNRPGQAPLYAPVGIQSKWDKSKRIAFATPIASLMAIVDRDFRAVMAQRQNDQSL
jgi:hypothetical protein